MPIAKNPKSPKVCRNLLIALAIIQLASLPASAGAPPGTTMAGTICTILLSIKTVITTIGSTLVVIMFVYGGLKYTFSADDAGGRKQGKMTCIHAVIGGILIVIADTV